MKNKTYLYLGCDNLDYNKNKNYKAAIKTFLSEGVTEILVLKNDGSYVFQKFCISSVKLSDGSRANSLYKCRAYGVYKLNKSIKVH